MRALRTVPALALVAAIAAASACAGGRGAAGRGSLLSDTPAPYDRACRVAESPAALPAPEALVQGPGFQAAAAAAWRAAGRPDGYILFSFRFGPDGVNVRRALIEHTVPAALADSLQKLAFVHRREVEPAGEEWGVRLRVDLAEPLLLRVGRSEVCAAAPRERELRRGGAAWADVRNAEAPPAAGFSTVRVRVLVDADGRVTDARLERSLGHPAAEQRLLQLVRTLAFEPATVDGYPVAGEAWLRLPVPR